MYDCHCAETCGTGATVCGGTGLSCVPGGTSFATAKEIWPAVSPESGCPSWLRSVNCTTGWIGACNGTETLVIVALIEVAVFTLNALTGPAGPAGPVGPVEPA